MGQKSFRGGKRGGEGEKGGNEQYRPFFQSIKEGRHEKTKLRKGVGGNARNALYYKGALRTWKKRTSTPTKKRILRRKKGIEKSIKENRCQKKRGEKGGGMQSVELFSLKLWGLKQEKTWQRGKKEQGRGEKNGVEGVP